MQTGAFTGYFDVAQVVLYAFWIFFAGVVLYCHRESKRDGGFPMVPDRFDRRRGRNDIEGFPPIPPPVERLLTHGAPKVPAPEREIMALPTGNWPGAPLQPTGNPMIDGVGPASYAMRVDHPELCFDDHGPKIVPLRKATDFWLATEDPDPRGMPLVGADSKVAGRIVDVWIDRSEVMARYLEAEIPVGDTTRRALIPFTLTTVRTGRRPEVRVRSITAAQFADVPTLRDPDNVTLLEEDKIMAYYAGGMLYAKAGRGDPLL